ncbi:trk system potassium uptake protein TrkA [Bacteroidales bacterium KHT7]|uniref:Trk system potassium transporter TrkA n=1 Tax=unclassified Bacteroides TaxID=2646097 RepID=UPI0004E22DFF|nr:MULTISPECIES: Trk system potassium transporter TrkA [unclassified Bacteroides]MBQ1676819.1 Trk system potassium transporter TrkA [Bacteroidaceae bacterium]SDG11865.1 trk system potassium uptake protein TrkA [Bacteroidales bacterium KHT7]MBQ2056898.1 Trk system potassium transporter TrkA [Bacteroidaceae bacterium]MBQ3874707.1 Trk system potassium transporter TrkA [Bacteroidaceae bacterium]MBQ7483659.1 Trk system potassium transporter TrkA [Bacteroidaceae bacterium]
MKIIIAGASPIGIHLAELLSREEQDIIVMDSDADKLSELDDNFDLLTLNISPSSIKGLKEAGVADADLFIATSTEEHYNITCCTMAHKLGAKKTIARVDNYEYMQDEYKEMFTELGISSLIYPEQLAGQEIINSIKTSWIRQWWEVEDGALVLIGVKVRQNASIIDTSLKELGIQKMPFHVVAIKRNGSMIIPHGDDMIRHLDIVYFMASKQDLPRIKQMVGKEDYRDVKNIAIMGGGKVAYHTVLQAPGYMRFKIVEIDEKRINELHQKLNISNDRLMIFRGDGRDISKFKEEYQNIEAFVALTGNSEHNILACLTAKSFGVRKTVAMVDNFEYLNMAESLDIGTLINKKTITASHIYQEMLDADKTNLKWIALANADVAVFSAEEGSKITKKQVKDLGMPKGMTLGGLVRAGKGMLIKGTTQIEPSDKVVVFCINMKIKNIEKYFKK